MTIKKFILFILTIVLASSYTIGQNAYQYIKEGDKAFTDADYYTAFYYFNKAASKKFISILGWIIF